MDEKTLQEIKAGFGISPDSTGADAALKLKIAAVESYMLGGGVTADMMADPLATGCIVVGVTDIWNLEAGEIKFSPVFGILMEQLKMRSAEGQVNDV